MGKFTLYVSKYTLHALYCDLLISIEATDNRNFFDFQIDDLEYLKQMGISPLEVGLWEDSIFHAM